MKSKLTASRSMRNGRSTEQSITEVEIDYDMFSEFEYSIILIKTLLDDHQNINVLGLVLVKLDGENTKYERVGFVAFHQICPKRFELWIQSWIQQTITLI